MEGFHRYIIYLSFIFVYLQTRLNLIQLGELCTSVSLTDFSVYVVNEIDHYTPKKLRCFAGNQWLEWMYFLNSTFFLGDMC